MRSLAAYSGPGVRQAAVWGSKNRLTCVRRSTAQRRSLSRAGLAISCVAEAPAEKGARSGPKRPINKKTPDEDFMERGMQELPRVRTSRCCTHAGRAQQQQQPPLIHPGKKARFDFASRGNRISSSTSCPCFYSLQTCNRLWCCHLPLAVWAFTLANTVGGGPQRWALVPCGRELCCSSCSSSGSGSSSVFRATASSRSRATQHRSRSQGVRQQRWAAHHHVLTSAPAASHPAQPSSACGPLTRTRGAILCGSPRAPTPTGSRSRKTSRSWQRRI
jgi:hypothetical protein